MRLIGIRRSAVVLSLITAIASPVLGQIQPAPPEVERTPGGQRRMPDQLPTPTPAPTPESTPTPAPTPPSLSIPAPAVPDDRTPDQIADDFFNALKNEDVEGAYEKLAAAEMIRARGEESRALRAQTQQAMDAYGPTIGHELVKIERVGDLLERRTYVLHGEVLPLRWRVYFYKGSGSWQVVDLRVDDALVELFDESGVDHPVPQKTAE